MPVAVERDPTDSRNATVSLPMPSRRSPLKQQVIIVKEEKGGCVGKTLALIGAMGSALWLLNLTMGIVEIPDNLPFIGNIDEMFAAGVFFSCLRYLGLDVIPFGRGKATLVTHSAPSDKPQGGS